MEKLTHKTPYKALCLIILGLLMITLIGIPFISADMTFDNRKYFNDKVGDYGKVWVEDWFGLGSTLVELELKENTDACGVNCSAEINITLNEEGVLISDIRFMVRTGKGWIEESIKSYELSIKNGKQTSHKELQDVCEVIGSYGNGTDITSCSEEFVDVYEDDYDIYNIGDELPVGTYYVKLEGEREQRTTIDWQITTSGKLIDDWAEWDFLDKWSLTAANADPFGISTNGSMILVGDTIDNLIYQYDMEGTPINSWSLNNTNTDADGIATNDTWLWVLDESDDEVYIYYTNGTWINSWDTNAAGNTFPRGVETNGTEGADCCIWTTDIGGDRIYKWKMDGTAVTSYALTAANDEPRGLATLDGTFLWVTDNTDAEVYKYWGNNGTYTGLSFDTFADGCTVISGITEQNSFWVVDSADDEVCRFERLVTEVTLNEPTNNSVFSDTTKNLTATYKGGGFLLKNATYNIWFKSNSTVFNKSTFTIPAATNITRIPFSDFIPANYLWNVRACGDNSTSTFCTFADSNFSFTVGTEVIAQNFSQNTTEGNSELFKVNVTTPSGYQLTVATLFYNNTNYIGTITNVAGNNYTARRIITIPSISTDTQFTFHWNFVLENGFGTNSSDKFQGASALVVDDCTAQSTQILNLTLKDEQNQTTLDGDLFNTSIEIDIDIFPIGSSTSILNYSNLSSEINPTSVCINDDLSNSTYTMDATIRYSSALRATEFYNIQGFSLTNSTIPQNINLYDLLSANAQEFRLRVRDTSFLPIDSALIQIERKYIEDGVFLITEIPKADEGGISSASLQTNDVIYNFKIFDAGTLVFTFNNVLAICQTPIISTCEIDFNAFQSSITIPDFEEGDDFNFTLGYNDSSKIINSQFVIPSGEPSTVLLVVTREDSLGTAVCTDTLTSASGTLSCVIPSSFGNSTVLAKIFKDGVEQGKGNIKSGQKSRDIFPGVLILLSILVMITLIGMGVSDNPIVTAIFLFVGVVVLFGINLIQNTGFVGATATILFFGIALILVIIKAARRS